LRETSSLVIESEEQEQNERKEAALVNSYQSPKLFILKNLVNMLPKSIVKGKLRNMENEFFDEYFGLLSSLIKISKEYLLKDDSR
jgi:hypothetical protein